MSVAIYLQTMELFIEVKGAVGLHSNLEQVDITQVLHCGGLLLCFTNNNRLVVWNPCLGETRWIHPKTTGYSSNFALGYQKNKSYHSYKILRCRHDFQLNNTSEIYEFGSDSWRVRDDIALDCKLTLPNQVSSQGNTFWLAEDRIFRNKRIVLSFDFTTERFKRFSLPKNPPSITSLSVVREEQLSFFFFFFFVNQDGMHCFVSNKMQVWVSDKIDNDAVVLSWSKSFKVDFQAIDRRFQSFMVDEEKKVVLCCDSCPWIRSMVYTFGEDFDSYTETPYVQSMQLDFPPFIFSYVPSLVHIQQE
uniref:F-box associated beta-propeller type 1 domain-containing protein n=1 Tax=Brassica oleracea TaxID=3712 RepID=A0A3P6APC4_BRAOL|nr:unnamed protein product [Brassica oleracea]